MKSDPTKETILFFGITLGLVYLLLWGPLVAFQIPAISFVDQQMGPAWPIARFFIGGFTLSLTALGLTWLLEGMAGLRSVWRRLVQFRIGWRGYAQDRLQTKFSPLVSGSIVGVFWRLWHLPLFFIPGTSQNVLDFPFLGFLTGVISQSVLYAWLHNRTGRSIWTAVFFHWIYTFEGQVVATV